MFSNVAVNLYKENVEGINLSNVANMLIEEVTAYNTNAKIVRYIANILTSVESRLDLLTTDMFFITATAEDIRLNIIQNIDKHMRCEDNNTNYVDMYTMLCICNKLVGVINPTVSKCDALYTFNTYPRECFNVITSSLESKQLLSLRKKIAGHYILVNIVAGLRHYCNVLWVKKAIIANYTRAKKDKLDVRSPAVEEYGMEDFIKCFYKHNFDMNNLPRGEVWESIIDRNPTSMEAIDRIRFAFFKLSTDKVDVAQL